MEDVKVYHQEVVEDTPFPQEAEVSTAVLQESSGNSKDGKTYSQSTIQDQSFPTKKIATELLSTMINTSSRKVLGEFQFTQMGAFQIGDYKDGESGDVRISRNGLVARNKLGSNTVVIDSDGNGYFAGELQTGSIITGLLLLGDGSIVHDGPNRRTVYFADDGLAAIVIGNK